MPRRKDIQVKQIQAPNWETHEVVIIRSLTGEDNDWVQDRSTVMTAGETNMRILAGTSQRFTLMRGIESWTFTSNSGQALPWPPLTGSAFDAINTAVYQIREQSLMHVFPEDRAFIFNEITKLGQPLSEDEKKPSSMSVPHGSLENHTSSHLALSTEK